MKSKSIALLLVMLLCGCATSSKINGVSLGMTKAEVLAVMGTPVSTSANEGSEYLSYRLSETYEDSMRGITTPYFVRIVNGRVDAYGRLGDFGSTAPATIRVQSESL